MVELQILNKILQDKSFDLLTANNITDEYFNEYAEQYSYLKNHFNKYGTFPDVETFLSTFSDFDLIVVNESPSYLVNTFREEYLYRQCVPILTKMNELMQTDTFEAYNFLQANLSLLKIPTNIIGIDIIGQAENRLLEYENVKKDKGSYFIPSGFKELDDIITGWHCGEELVVLFARTGQGKSWVLIKILEHSWKMNKRVALLEPEMSANKTGYRFDTVHKNISNTNLLKGNDIQGYDKYINNLKKSEVPFYVVHPKDFDRKVTVSKLRSFVETNKIDILAIDGISYLTDERKERGDSRTTQLTNISEDLMEMSIELGIPIIVVCQSNREGAKENDLQLENIRDSDGIAYNASLVISVQQKKDIGLQLAINKSRNSSNNAKLTYLWDIDKGVFEYVPSKDSGIDDEEQAENLRRRFTDSNEEY